MRRVVAVLCVLALLAASFVAGTWWQAEAPGRSAPSGVPGAGPGLRAGSAVPAAPVRARRAAAGDPAAAESASPATAPIANVPAADAKEPARVVRILLPDGSPAAGAKVTLESGRRRAGVPATRTADSRGEVTVPSDEIRSARTIRAEWLGTHTASRELPSSGSPGAADSIELQLRAGWTLRGRVESGAGEPIGNAELVLRWPRSEDDFPNDERTAKSDADGRFEFPPMPALAGEQTAYVEVTAAGFVAAQENFSVSDPPADPLVVALERGVKVRGRCVDEQGRPVAQVPIRRGYRQATTSDAAGRFEADGFPVQGERLIAAPEHLAPVVVSGVDGSRGDVDVGDLVLRAGESIRGTFVGSDGGPIAKGHLSLTPSGDDEGDGRGWYRSVESGADGSFTFRALAPGTYKIEGTEPGAFAQARSAAAHDVRAGTSDLRLALPPGMSVRFDLKLASDRSVVSSKKVNVEIVRGEGQSISGRGWHTGSGGLDHVVYVFEAVGTFSADVTVPGFERARVEDFEVRADRETSVDVLLTPVPGASGK